MNPADVVAHEDLMEMLTAVGEFNKAREVYQDIVRLNLDDDSPHLYLYVIAALENNAAEMTAQSPVTSPSARSSPRARRVMRSRRPAGCSPACRSLPACPATRARRSAVAHDPRKPWHSAAQCHRALREIAARPQLCGECCGHAARFRGRPGLPGLPAALGCGRSRYPATDTRTGRVRAPAVNSLRFCAPRRSDPAAVTIR